MIAGTAALLAVTAILALGVGAAARRSAGAAAAVIVAIVLPLLLAITNVMPADATDWLLRLTPAAGFAVQQTLPQYPQVSFAYTPANGFYPLAPWGRVRRAVRLPRGGLDPGHLPAPKEGRMSPAPLAYQTGMTQARHTPRAGGRRPPTAARAHLPQALHAEWTKLRTVAGTYWLLAAAIALTVTVGAAVAAATRCPAGPARGCDRRGARLALPPAGHRRRPGQQP